MKFIYPAIFYKDLESDGYSIVFPDINQGATCGDDIEEAYYMAEDFLGLALYDDYISGKTLPPASKIQEIEYDEEFSQFSNKDLSFKTLISVDMDDYIRRTSTKTIKKTVTIPSYLNEMAKAHNINFSQVLTEGLINELQI